DGVEALPVGAEAAAEAVDGPALVDEGLDAATGPGGVDVDTAGQEGLVGGVEGEDLGGVGLEDLVGGDAAGLGDAVHELAQDAAVDAGVLGDLLEADAGGHEGADVLAGGFGVDEVGAAVEVAAGESAVVLGGGVGAGG